MPSRKNRTLPAAITVIGAHTETGPVREANEDNLYVAPAYNFAVICDGMGGHAGGEVASELAVNAAAESLTQSVSALRATPKDRVVSAALQAQAKVLEASQQNSKLRGMGTTLVAVLVDKGKIHVVSVGDSRAYLVRDGEATPITLDETPAGQLFRQGLITWDALAGHPARNTLLRSIGHPWTKSKDIDYDVQYDAVRANPNDRVVLCTDGVYDSLTLEDVASLSQGPPREAAHRLVQTAIERDGSDNATAIVLEVKPEGAVAVPPKGAYLQSTEASAVPLSMLLEYGAYVLGAEPRAVPSLKKHFLLPISHPRVSGQHALLVVDSNGVSVADMGSLNGTWLNGVKLSPHEWYTVEFGDTLALSRQVSMQFARANRRGKPVLEKPKRHAGRGGNRSRVK